MARKQQKDALVISKNGDGEKLQATISKLGFNFIPAGNGHEGRMAIQRYQPTLIIIFCSPLDEDDVVALRAAQSSLVASIVFSHDTKRTERLLGLGRAKACQGVAPHRCGVFDVKFLDQLEAAIRTQLSQ